MKKTSIFLFSSLLLFVVIEAGNQVVYGAPIYDPLNPVQEIIPTDQPEDQDEAEKEPQATTQGEIRIEEAEEPEVEPEKETVTDLNEQKMSMTENQEDIRIRLDEVFIEEPAYKGSSVVLSNTSGDGDGHEAQSYLTSLCYLLCGSAFYGTKRDERENNYVYDVFR